jgi:hypothetical protein
VVANVARLRNLGYNFVTVFEAAPLQYAQLFAASETQGYGYIIRQNGAPLLVPFETPSHTDTP